MTQDQTPQPQASAIPHGGDAPTSGPSRDAEPRPPWPRAVFWIMFALLAAVVAAMQILPGYGDILWARLHGNHPGPATPDEAFHGSFPWIGVLYIVPNLLEMVRNNWSFPTQTLLGLGVGGTLLAGLFGIGYGALSRIRPWRRMVPRVIERAALALPVAAVPVSLAVLGLGLAGLANPMAYGTLLALLVIAGVPGWIAFLKEMRRGGWRTAWRAIASVPRLPLILFCFLFLLALVYTLSPAVESDELRYHLAPTATWLRDGRIHYLPYQAFSNFPMLGEMLFMLARSVGGDAAAKLIHLAFLPVCMLLIGLTAARLGNCGLKEKAECGMRNAENGFCCSNPQSAIRDPQSAILPALAFAFIPMVPILAAWGFIDMFVVAYFMAFVYLAGRALEHPGRAAGSLIGLVAGGGIAVKYTLVILLGLLGGLWSLLLWLAPRGRRRLARLTFIVAAFTLLWGGAWYLKNAVWTGNPVYFGGWSIFHGGEWSLENSKFYRWKSDNNAGWHLTHPAGMAAKPFEFLLSPLTTAVFPSFFENPLGALPLLALLLGLGWWAAGKIRQSFRYARTSPPISRFRRWIVSAAAVSWVAWFPGYQSNRFLLPTAALLLALAGPALAGWSALLPRGPRLALRLMLTLVVLQSFLFINAQILAPWDLRQRPNWELTGTTKADGVAVALGFEDPNFYLAHRLNYWHAAQWLAHRARPGEKALLVGEHRTLHFNLPLIASDWFDTPQPLPWIRSTPDNDTMLDQMSARGVRFLFLNQGELSLQASFFFKRFHGETELNRFQTLWTNPRLKQIYPYEEKIAIFEIAPRH